jgi:hypothetical protein
VGEWIFFPTGVETVRIRIARTGNRQLELTVADPDVVLTARRS